MGKRSGHGDVSDGVKGGRSALHRAAAAAVLVTAQLATTGVARAYSDPFVYPEPATQGGGGGRWFTGSPADGYGCDVCHQGGAPAELEIGGLPAGGYTPGANYEVVVSWPFTAEHVALVAEFSDENGLGAGGISPPAMETITPAELCVDGAFPIQPLSDNATGRNFVTIVDCGARMTRFRWTAPTAAASTPPTAGVAGGGAPAGAAAPAPVLGGPPPKVWFNLGFVLSNADTRPEGDGVTLVAYPMAPLGQAQETQIVAQGCALAAIHETGPRHAWIGTGSGIVVLLALRRAKSGRRKRGRR